MEYFKIKGVAGTFCEVDPETNRAIVFKRSETNAEISLIQEEIAQLSEAKTNAQLLQWARENYPYAQQSERLGVLQSRKEYLESRIEAINTL